MLVSLKNVSLPQHRVHDAVHLSRCVARGCGNRTWDRPIKIITDQRHAALRALPPEDIDARRPARLMSRFTRSYGLCWRDAGVIWISPDVPHEYLARVTAHEVAHSLTSGLHGEAWRRMYARLLPLWHKIIYGDAMSSCAVYNEMRRVVEFYGRYTRPSVAVDEIVRMDNIAHDSYERWPTEIQ